MIDNSREYQWQGYTQITPHSSIYEADLRLNSMALRTKPWHLDKAIDSALNRQVKADSRTDARKLVDRLTAQAIRDMSATTLQQGADRTGKA